MAAYTRYSVNPGDVRRRQRRRTRNGNGAHKHRYRWIQIVVLVVVLLVVTVLGMGAGAIFALSRDLPSLEELRRRPNAVNTVIYDRHGQRIAELHGAENRVLVTSEQIPEVMKQATVAVEDERFYTHHGVDFQGVVRAVIENLRAGGVVQGGSTITEQFVKNAYVGNERTYTRKLREAVLAWQLEDRWSKDQILTEYLNTVYYGAGAYGVEAAARTYFHKPASKLTTQQAALLAALPKFPTQYSPTADPKMAKEQRNKVLGLMATQGYITPVQAAGLSQRRLGVYKHPPASKDPLADYFTDYVTRQLTKRYGSRQVFEGGLKVYTSIDMKWQRAAIDVIKGTTGPLDFGFKPSAALVAIDPRNGYIRTMVGGLDYKKQKFNLAWQAKRQAGSSMKPFVLTAAVLQGMNPDTTFYSSKSPIIIPMGYGAEPWLVNGDGPGGPESVSAATTISDNVVFAQLSIDVGPQNTVDVAHKMGITSDLDAVPSITLGTSPVSPLEMADAYATLASGGIRHKPQAIVKVVLPDGRVDWRPKTKGNRAIPAGVASVVTRNLERVASGGTGSPTGSYFPYPRAGKTGTTENGWDVWYVGYTPQLAASVWMGDAEKNSPMSGAYGGTYCAPMWAKFFAAALKSKSKPGFTYASWTFSPWHGKMQDRSPSASPSASGSPSPKATKTIKPTVAPTPKPTTPKPTPTTPPPTPTPTVTPSAVRGVAPAAQASGSAGDGSRGLVGAVAGWFAGLLSL
ncbi:MAG: transglycosylase domain-containing protein [Thermoleophilia bacterium]